jgi:hypothetical protein
MGQTLIEQSGQKAVFLAEQVLRQDMTAFGEFMM